MTHVTLQFCGSSGLMSQAIAWFTQGDGIAHVDAVTPSGALLGAQQASGLGGMPSGVYARPADYGAAFGMTKCVSVALPATPEQEDAFYEFLQAQVGKPYDLTCIAGFVAGRDWHDPGAWICSELQAAALEHAGIIRPLAAPANKITPAGLLLVCSAVGTVALVD